MSLNRRAAISVALATAPRGARPLGPSRYASSFVPQSPGNFALPPPSVMPGLVPGIHASPPNSLLHMTFLRSRVGGRDKPGHDDWEIPGLSVPLALGAFENMDIAAAGLGQQILGGFFLGGGLHAHPQDDGASGQGTGEIAGIGNGGHFIQQLL